MYDVIIVGAGASGSFLALTLKYKDPNLKVLILEKNNKLGKKLLLTGNGRCNIGNTNIKIHDYSSNSSLDNLKNLIENENKTCVRLLNNFGVLTTNEEDRLYPYSNQSLTVCKSFERALINYNVDIIYNYNVTEIKKRNDIFIINNDLESENVVIATGGKTYPKTGSDGSGYDLLRSFGHSITKLYPSLTSLKTNFKYINDLKGIRVNAKVSLYDNDVLIDEEKGQLQITNDALSGICIFNLSRYACKLLQDNKKLFIKVDYALDKTKNELYNYIKLFPNYNIEDALCSILNNKLSLVIIKYLKLKGKKVKNLKDSEIDKVIDMIKNMKFEIISTGDFNNAQVTSGGALLDEFKEGLESKKCKGLFAIGEVLDIDGKCGGYNLSWAFVSALIVSNKITKCKAFYL